jgi:hypothetical protein
MDKFKKWMIEKGYLKYEKAINEYYMYRKVSEENGDYFIPEKLDYLRYMIEYLHSIGVIHRAPFNMNIEGLYCYLEDLIDEIEDLDNDK